MKVVAAASDHADGVAIAVASGNIFANDFLKITRSVVDFAYANNPAGGGNASALADLSLRAKHGDVTIHSDLTPRLARRRLRVRQRLRRQRPCIPQCDSSCQSDCHCVVLARSRSKATLTSRPMLSMGPTVLGATRPP